MPQREPLTYAKIEDNLRLVMNRTERLVEEFAAAVDAKAPAEAAFKSAWARARIQFRAERQGQKVTEGMVDDHATVATEQEHLAYLLAQAAYESKKQALYNAQRLADDLRSLMASYRETSG